MAIYLKSLKDPQNIFSGDCDLLPYPVSSAYSNYESSCEELYSSKQSGLVCKEELDELRQETVENADAYHVALKKAFEEFRKRLNMLCSKFQTAISKALLVNTFCYQ